MYFTLSVSTILGKKILNMIATSVIHFKLIKFIKKVNVQVQSQIAVAHPRVSQPACYSTKTKGFYICACVLCVHISLFV